MRVLISGSHGLIGSALHQELGRRGNFSARLLRQREKSPPCQPTWRPEEHFVNAAALEGFDAVVHLAGENIAGRWSSRKKDLIRRSRVDGTRLLCDTLIRLDAPPQALLCASAVGYYGNRGTEPLQEGALPGVGFLASVCKEWEEAARVAEQRGIRVVNLRFGVILDKRGGALKTMLPSFRLGLGARLGSGAQIVSWVTLADAIKAALFVLDNAAITGPVNVTAPEAVSNEQFAAALAGALRRPTRLRVPEKVLRTMLGDLADEVLLASVRAEPHVLLDHGFKFDHPNLPQALAAIL